MIAIFLAVQKDRTSYTDIPGNCKSLRTICSCIESYRRRRKKQKGSLFTSITKSNTQKATEHVGDEHHWKDNKGGYATNHEDVYRGK